MNELQFPKDPAVGQEYDFAPYRYYWDGTKWKTKGIGYNPVNVLRDELEPRISNNEAKVFEALRRSYAAAGLNLVEIVRLRKYFVNRLSVAHTRAHSVGGNILKAVARPYVHNTGLTQFLG